MASSSAVRLLVLAPFPPRLDGLHGGARVVAGLVNHLAARHPTALLCLRGRDEAPVDEVTRAVCALVEEVPRPGVPGSVGGRWRRRGRLAIGQAVGRPIWATDWYVPEFACRAKRVARTFAPDIVQIEYHVMAQYLSAVDGCAAPRVLVEHEPGPALDRSGRRGLVERVDALAWRRFQRYALSHVQAVVTFTDPDRRTLAGLAARAPIVTIPFGTECPARALDPLGASRPTLVFVGNFIHPPNVDAAVWLGGTIFPRVQARWPGVRLQIVGQAPPPEVQRLSGPDVEVTGWVPDVTSYLDRASIVVAPLRRGGGMRVKVLEALAAGKALVASRLAVEGLDVTDGHECVLADTDREYVEAIQQLMRDPDLRAALATRARRWALANLGWERTIGDYEALYTRLLEPAG